MHGEYSGMLNTSLKGSQSLSRDMATRNSFLLSSSSVKLLADLGEASAGSDHVTSLE